MVTSSPKVLVVGPTLLDTYYIGDVNRLDQTAPVPIVDITKGAVGAGGAANAAQTLAQLGADTMLVTALSATVGAHCETILRRAGVKLAVAKAATFVQEQKHRVYTNGRMFARFDLDGNGPSVSAAVRDAFAQACALQKPDVILLSDYGKYSVVSPEAIEAVLRYAKAEGVPVVVDPSVRHMAHYKDVFAITPSKDQLRAYAPHQAPSTTMRDIESALHPEHLIVTRSEQGARWLRDGSVLSFPAIPAICADSCGAGDAFVAALTYQVGCRGRSADMSYAINYGIAAGAAAVQVLGAIPVGAHIVLQKQVEQCGPSAKILPLAEALRMRRSIKLSGERFGIANGVFDLMHAGHIDMLRKAAKQCDFLLVLVNADASATRVKRKPINPCELRTQMLANLAPVNAVLVFEHDDPAFMFGVLEPDVIIKGPGNTVEMTPGAETAVRNGANFVVTDKTHDTSTTATIREVTERAKDDATPAAPDSGS